MAWKPQWLRSASTRKKRVEPGPGRHQFFSLPVGEMRSQGVELDLLGRLTPHLAASVGLAYTDPQVTRSSAAAAGTGLAEGRRFPNVSRFSGNAFLNYEQPLTGKRSAAIGMGVSHTGERLGSVDSNTDFCAARLYRVARGRPLRSERPATPVCQGREPDRPPLRCIFRTASNGCIPVRRGAGRWVCICGSDLRSSASGVSG